MFRAQEFFWSSEVLVADSPLGSTVSLPLSSWIGFRWQAQLTPVEWALCSIEQLLVTAKIRVPLLPLLYVLLVTVVHRLITAGLLVLAACMYFLVL